MNSIRVVFLGAGDAFCSGGRHQAGYLVQASGTSFLLDCGATTLASLKRDRISTQDIDAILISHLHGDHFSGLPFLFLEYTHVEPRRRPLLVAGPPGIERRVHELFHAMYRESASQPLPFPIQFIEMLPDRPLNLQQISIDPFRVPHQEKEISLALGVRVDGRSILYSGDTGWTEELIARSQNQDLFICECCFFETRVPFHLDYPCLETHRERFGAKRMILTHLGREVLARRDRISMELAHDGLIVEL